MTVTYQSNQTLKILEAIAKIKQRSIVLKFDNNIQCTNNFEDIFEPLLNITDDGFPKIKCKGKILKKYRLIKGPQSFTSLKADLCKNINRVSSFSSWLNGIFTFKELLC